MLLLLLLDLFKEQFKFYLILPFSFLQSPFFVFLVLYCLFVFCNSAISLVCLSPLLLLPTNPMFVHSLFPPAFISFSSIQASSLLLS